MPEKKHSFDYVIKFGGSITERGSIQQIESIGRILAEIFALKKNFVIVPGGGSFAEEVRRMQNKFHFSDEQAHWMAVYAMEQHALVRIFAVIVVPVQKGTGFTACKLQNIHSHKPRDIDFTGTGHKGFTHHTH